MGSGFRSARPSLASPILSAYTVSTVTEADAFEEAVRKIADEYQRLGHRLGWRFLTTQRRTLRTAKTALITLNPGGDYDPPEHGRESSEPGSAYLCESWDECPPGEARLQVQVQRLFNWLGEDLNEALSAHFIPFRSPNYRDLHERKASLEFASSLWRRLLSTIAPTLVISIGGEAFKGIRKILSDIRGAPIRQSEFPLGWNKMKATLVRYHQCLLIGLPHLSRFSIFGRSDSHANACLDQILRAIREQRPARSSTGLSP